MSTNPIHYEEDKLVHPIVGDLAETRCGALVQILDVNVRQNCDPVTGSIITQTRYIVMPVGGLSLIFDVPDLYKPATPMFGEEKFVVDGDFSELFN